MKMIFDVQERVNLSGLLAGYKGNMVTVKAFKRFSGEVLSFGPKEIGDFDIVATTTPDGSVFYRWSPEKTEAFGPGALSAEVEVSTQLVTAIKQHIKQLEMKNLLGKEVESIYDKFFADERENIKAQVDVMLKRDKEKTE